MMGRLWVAKCLGMVAIILACVIGYPPHYKPLVWALYAALAACLVCAVLGSRPPRGGK